MAKKARKSKGSKPRAAQEQSGTRKLRELIEGVIESQHRGDPAKRKAALDALAGFKSGSPQLRQHLVEAQAAAQNAVDVDRVRLLGEIALRVDSGS